MTTFLCDDDKDSSNSYSRFENIFSVTGKTNGEKLSEMMFRMNNTPGKVVGASRVFRSVLNGRSV